MKMNLQYLHKAILVFSLLVLNIHCGGVGENTQSTKLLEAKPFVSQLFGETTKTISINVQENERIAWVGLDQSANYKYFAMTKISINGRTRIPKIIDPTDIEKNIIAYAPLRDSDPVLYPNQLLVTLKYSPIQAIENEGKPHKAYLLITHAEPEIKTTRIELKGLTQGVLVSPCTRSPSSMDEVRYSLVNGTIDLYICDKNGVPDSQVNSSLGSKTNLTPVPIDGDLVFYKPDSETICMMGSDKPGGQPEPTIVDFKLPIPKGISETTDNLGFLDVNVPRGLRAQCSLDIDGKLNCDNTFEVEVYGGGVPVSPFKISNDVENPTARDCLDFGEISGEGAFGSSDDITLIGWSEVLPNVNTEQFNIDGALVVGVFKLTPAN